MGYRFASFAFAALIATLWSAQPAFAAPADPDPTPHIVQTGETLWSIARRHGLSVDALAAINGLPDDNRLYPGQRVILGPSAGTLQGVPRPRLAWPSRGLITSRFGFRWGRHHHGIDIAAPAGTPITAALDGTVQFAGRLAGYGRLVILNHGGGLTTYYGHASQLLVKVGDRVTQGQLVARVGATGEVTGPNLHFEVRRNKVPLDPLAFLQGQR
ncbi:MAG: LysM peptidoglycan-binding domain-containing M23 family metallopeptidase [Armatimonadota bacterium]|nr:LysM peptidoglycan-binding domain-containing M23 family metallopeptidase [Armatimonadota bacterium]MDR7466775.1 LysM peptidoglycan-binding domain-containing M23 family metallopeptidase [Armatimonadota bacterium]MDR7492752.1 LysM peptidoglycan-binding domain-containing M23 family metallopeptidase [Armatimonadota bacterium]MDR7498528.1 LysM peptidoglycan-binding domain-containing M23 family metallopeptidase [Armatimonadota bacterium]MDR7504307.1 LysM peptidoglycan-binding domain-containing M23